MTDKEQCPKCKRHMVYTRHLFSWNKCDTWQIYCEKCGIKTSECGSYDKARSEWERIKKDYD